jgi:hypothetical protein
VASSSGSGNGTSSVTCGPGVDGAGALGDRRADVAACPLGEQVGRDHRAIAGLRRTLRLFQGVAALLRFKCLHLPGADSQTRDVVFAAPLGKRYSRRQL